MAAEAVIDVWRARAGARCALRAILASYAGCEPREVALERGPHGKPFLRGGPWFSCSHSGQEAIVAVSHDRPVGVDVERVRPRRGLERVVRRRFARAEAQAIASLAPAARPRAFHDCWTAKEAYAKGLGEGLAVGLASFSVAGIADRERDRVAVAHPARPGERWIVQRLPAPAGYAAALAAPGGDWRPVARGPLPARAGDG